MLPCEPHPPPHRKSCNLAPWLHENSLKVGNPNPNPFLAPLLAAPVADGARTGDAVLAVRAVGFGHRASLLSELSMTNCD
jgi:hypothetical protein